MYPADEIPEYPREQFIDDLLREHETEVRNCLRKGAHKVQIDFTEGRLAVKIDPSGDLLHSFIDLNNLALSRFSAEDRKRIGVHTCPGSDRDSTHSGEVDYSDLLPSLFELLVGNFYIALAGERDRAYGVLEIIRRYRKLPTIGSSSALSHRSTRASRPGKKSGIESWKRPCYIPVGQLGSTDDWRILTILRRHVHDPRHGIREDPGARGGHRDGLGNTRRRLMAAKDDEEELLRSVALQNAQSILLARRRAEEALREQTEWLRVTLASIGDAVISTDAEGRVTFMNGVAEALTGWPQAEAMGRPLPDIFHIVNERTRQPVENPALHALREGTRVGLANHTVLIARDGTERPIDDSAAPMRDEGGTALGAVLVFRDVSDRKRAEEVRARLSAIIESTEDAIVSKTLDGVIRSWNAGAERLFGYTAEEAVGQPVTLIIPPERQDEERLILERLCRGEPVEHFETVRVAKDGRRIDVSLMISPIRDDAGQIIGASKIARDITERKRAEVALRESEARYRRAAAEAARTAEANAKFRAFFDQGTNFAGVLGLDGTVVEANRLCLDACGFARDEVIGKPFWECGWWNRSAALIEMVRAACLQAAGGRMFRTETHYFVADGTERVVDLILAPVTDEAGRVLFVAATGTDVTDRRGMEDALREQDRRKDEFLALLAHELRNPLAPLRNGLEVMRLAPGDAEAVSQARGMMERQLAHMVRLIDDLLDVSRISRNKMELRRSRVLLADVIAGRGGDLPPDDRGRGA